MAAKSVTHAVSLSLGDVALALSDTQTAAADPTNFALGDGSVGLTPEFLSGSTSSAGTIADVKMSGGKVMLLLKNETDAGGADLLVSLEANTQYLLSLKPQQINLLTITNLENVKIVSSGGTALFSYMAVQIDA